MIDGYKFKLEYEMPQDDENLNDTSKIRLVTYGDTAKEAVTNHRKFMHAWRTFLKKEDERMYKEEAYKTCEELEAMNQ
jgi:hypothetical protein